MDVNELSDIMIEPGGGALLFSPIILDYDIIDVWKSLLYKQHLKNFETYIIKNF